MSKGISKGISIFLAVMFVFTLFLTGCGQEQAANPEVTKEETKAPEVVKEEKKEIPKIRFAHNWTGGDAKAAVYEAALNEFAEKNKDKFELVFEANLVTAHADKMKVDIASDNIADVFLYWVGPSNLLPLVTNKKIVTAEEFSAASPVTKIEQWSESTYKDLTIEGQKYGFPVEAFKGFFLANKSLFDKYGLKYPVTYAELLDVSKVFKENGIVPLCVGSKGGNPGHFFLDAITYQFDKGYDDAMNIATTNQFNTPATLKGAQLVEEMVKNKMFPSDTIANGDWGPSLTIYNQSKAAMTYTFPWMIGAIDPAVKENSEIIPFPKMDGAVNDPANFYLGGVAMGYQVSAKAFADPAKKDAIIEFVDYLVSDEQFSVLAKASMFPAKNAKLDTNGLDSTYIKVNEYTSKQKDMYFGAYTTMPTPALGDLRMSSIDELFAGALTAQEFVEKVQKEFDKLKK